MSAGENDVVPTGVSSADSDKKKNDEISGLMDRFKEEIQQV